MLQKYRCFFAVIVVIGSIVSCGRKGVHNPQWNNSFPAFTKTVDLKLKEVKTFVYDSITSLQYGLIQYDEKSNEIIGFSCYDKSFVFYDYETERPIKKINIKDSIGPISPFGYSFFYKSDDSIFLFRQSHAQFFLVNKVGNIRLRDSLMGNNYHTPANMVVGEQLPVSGNIVYFSAFPGRQLYKKDILRDNLIISYDLLSKKKTPFFRYPPIYADAVWGEYLHWMYKCFNPRDKKIIISFPITHNIYVFDVASGQTTTYYAGSSILEHVEPLSYELDLPQPLRKNQEMNQVITQHTYRKILYDPYRNCYYRTMTNAVPAVDVDKVNMRRPVSLPPFSVIILDSAFKKIGEVEFDANTYSGSSLFISKEGLCIPRTTSKPDEEISFGVFELKSINK